MTSTCRESFVLRRRRDCEVPDLEQLYADGGKHELEQKRDQHDVVDGSNGDDDALHDVLLYIHPFIHIHSLHTKVLVC